MIELRSEPFIIKEVGEEEKDNMLIIYDQEPDEFEYKFISPTVNFVEDDRKDRPLIIIQM